MRTSLVIFVTILLIGPAVSRADGDKTCAPLASGARAPRFSLSRPDGDDVSLNAALRKGLPVVVSFWDVKCEGCVEELPMLQRVADSGKATFLLVHATKRPAEMLETLRRLHMTLPSATDDYGINRQAWCANPLPRTFVINPSGTIRATFAKPDEQALRDAIAAAR